MCALIPEKMLSLTVITKHQSVREKDCQKRTTGNHEEIVKGAGHYFVCKADTQTPITRVKSVFRKHIF